MSEEELLTLLDVPPDAWSPFFLATRACLCSVGGLLNLSSAIMAKAVKARYLKKEAKIEVHATLLKFLENAPSTLCSYERKMAELAAKQEAASKRLAESVQAIASAEAELAQARSESTPFAHLSSCLHTCLHTCLLAY